MKTFTVQELQALAERFAATITDKTGPWTWAVALPDTGGTCIEINFRRVGGMYEHLFFSLNK